MHLSHFWGSASGQPARQASAMVREGGTWHLIKERIIKKERTDNQDHWTKKNHTWLTTSSRERQLLHSIDHWNEVKGQKNQEPRYLGRRTLEKFGKDEECYPIFTHGTVRQELYIVTEAVMPTEQVEENPVSSMGETPSAKTCWVPVMMNGLPLKRTHIG